MEELPNRNCFGINLVILFVCNGRSKGSRPQGEGTNFCVCVFIPVWPVLTCCEATNLGVFDLCHFDLLQRTCAKVRVGLELTDKSLKMPSRVS